MKERARGSRQLEARGEGQAWKSKENEPLEHELFRVGIARDIRRETDGRRTLSRSVNSPGRDLVHILEQRDTQRQSKIINEHTKVAREATLLEKET